MGLDVSIKTNAIDVKHFLNRLERSQLPFAISRAINSMAYDVRDAAQEDMPNYFDIRTRWLLKRGAMPVIPSKKSQYPNIFAVIGVKDRIAANAAIGGLRPGTGKTQAVPFSDAGEGKSARAILNPSRKTLPQSKWPKMIVKDKAGTGTRRSGRKLKPKPFFMTTRTGRKFVALRSSSSTNVLLFLYEFKRSTRMQKTWPLIRNVELEVAFNYDRVLQRELNKAVATMK